MSDRRPPSDDERPGGSRASGEGSDSLPPTEIGARTPRRRRDVPPTELFEAEEVLAGRYRILRFLAAGGAGEVYEAEDRELGDRVAVKVLHPVVAEGAGSLERFKREIHLARQVTHPNVCRIYDVGRHARPMGADTYFLTMEFLEGTTLSQRIRERGRLAPEEALPIARQLASALEAAHRVGVVHRDFKSGNVMLVPDEREETGTRAMVTDFGLARGVGAGKSGAHRTVTSGAEMVGTPGYMAPEQVEGGEVTPLSDLYAFGVVLYEMVTGQWPFTGDTPLAVAAKRLRQPPAPPREIVPELPSTWERAILRCLEVDPADRFRSPGHVIAALEGRRPVPPGPAARRLAWTGGILLLASLLGLFAVLRLGRGDAASPADLLRSSLTPVQLTTSPGLEIDPAFSPEGRRLAFASDKGGRFDLYVRSLAPGARDVLVTTGEEGGLQPTWSPDGEWIAYTAPDGGIEVIPALGGVGRRLTTFGSRAAWSPDGTLVAFQEDYWPQTAVNVATALPPSTLWIVPAAGGEPRRLTDPGRPAGGHGAPVWSPDGDRILFTSSGRTGSEAWTVRPDGTGLERIESDLVRIYEPRYLGREDLLLAAGVRRETEEGIGLWALERRRPDDPYVARSLPMPGAASLRQLAVSPEGDGLAFTALSTRSNLATVALDPETGLARGEVEALTEDTGRNTRPSFSPDGSRLVFERWRTGVRSDLYLLELATGDLTQLTLHDATDAHGRWFPDGERIGFLSARDVGLGFYGLGIGGAPPARLHGFESEIDWARLSPDGRSVAYHDAHRRGTVDIWVLDLASGSARQLTGDDRREAFPVWSPDSRRLAFQVQSGEDSLLRLVDVATGSVRELDGGLRLHFPYSFSPDGSRLAYAGFDTAWNLWWIDLETGRRERLTDRSESAGYLRYPAWSPRGDRVVFERAETAGDLWLVDDLLAPEPSG